MVRTLKPGLRLRCLATVSVRTLAILLEMKNRDVEDNQQEEEETKHSGYVSFETVGTYFCEVYVSLA